MEDRTSPIDNRITFIGSRKDGVPLWEIPGTIGMSSFDEKDLTYNTLIIGSTGRGKSVFTDKLEEFARAQGYTVEHVEAAPGIRSGKPKEPLPPVKIDEYLTLPGELFRDASGCIYDILGCYLTQKGVARFLAESRIGAQILWFNEVETTIRDDMVRALEIFLTGEDSWVDSKANYQAHALLLRAAARARGYLAEES